MTTIHHEAPRPPSVGTVTVNHHGVAAHFAKCETCNPHWLLRCETKAKAGKMCFLHAIYVHKWRPPNRDFNITLDTGLGTGASAADIADQLGLGQGDSAPDARGEPSGHQRPTLPGANRATRRRAKRQK